MRFFSLALFLMFHILCQAQATYRAGLLPAVNLNKKLGRDYSVNAKVESRQLLSEGSFEDRHEVDYQYVLTDISLVLSKKVGVNNTLAGGYLVRIRHGVPAHRLIQQFTMVRRYADFRLAHRISADQTLGGGEKTEWRLRYRISAELPLTGQAVNAREFYFKANHEYLNAFQGGGYDLEIRLVPLLGYAFTDNSKLEFGPDYRLGSLTGTYPTHSFWWSCTWYVSL